MRIAIITLYGNFNYGNRLQNYALQTLLERFGHYVSTIAVDADVNLLKRFLKKYICRTNDGYSFKTVQEMVRERAFTIFTKKYINTCCVHTIDGKIPQRISDNYDVFVVGSDQVWNPLFWEDSDESKDLYNYFLGFSNKKKIAYAASFGVENISNQWIQRIQPLVSKFSMVSVREKSGCKIIQKMGVTAQLVLDPTLLLDVKTWRKFEKNSIKKGFILTYFLGEQPDFVIREIQAMAKDKDVKIVNLYDKKEKYYNYGPEVFLELIDKAEIVYTDSFHATVFSILFHTEFAVFERKHANQSDMSDRIKTLFDIVDIENGISKSKIIYNCDFRNYEKLLCEEREKSILLLHNMLLIS